MRVAVAVAVGLVVAVAVAVVVLVATAAGQTPNVSVGQCLQGSSETSPRMSTPSAETLVLIGAVQSTTELFPRLGKENLPPFASLNECPATFQLTAA